MEYALEEGCAVGWIVIYEIIFPEKLRSAFLHLGMSVTEHNFQKFYLKFLVF